VSHIRAIDFDLANPDNLDNAHDKIRAQVKAFEEGEPLITPIQIGVVLRSLETGSTQDEQILGAHKGILEGISQLQRSISATMEYERQKYFTEIGPNVLLSPPPPPSPSGFGLSSLLTPRSSAAESNKRKRKRRRRRIRRKSQN
jgi:hypothetical protein